MTKQTATPVSTSPGQITKENIKQLNALLQSNPKTINWNKIKNLLLKYHPKAKAAPNLNSILRLALHRACFDRSGKSALKIILQKLENLSLPERVEFAITAVQCNNMTALEAIIDDDPSVLFYCSNGSSENDDSDDSDGDDDSTAIGSAGGATLLHLVCERHGWNNEIKFILKEILKNNIDRGNGSSKNEGLFYETKNLQIPLILSLQDGSDLNEIIDYLRDKHPAYLEANIDRVSQIITEYWADPELLSDLIRCYDGLLLDSFHPRDGSSPLHFACYYQNYGMIHVLLHEYFKYYRYGEEGSDTYNCLLQVQKRLLSPNNECISPLGYLLLNIGDSDAENAWRCVDSCVSFFADQHILESLFWSGDEESIPEPQQRFQFSILHVFLSQTWDMLIAKRNYMKILDQIVHRLEIDVCEVDKESGNTVLSIVIEKIMTTCTVNDTKKNRELSLKILDYFVVPVAVSLTPAGRCPAATRDGYNRLPLHSACEWSLPWKMGLESIVNANMPALELVDPITGLPTFAHCAVGAQSDLESIYELLRLHPGSIDSVLSFSNAI